MCVVMYYRFLPVESSASYGCQIGEDTQVCHVLWPRLDVQETYRDTTNHIAFLQEHSQLHHC